MIHNDSNVISCIEKSLFLYRKKPQYLASPDSIAPPDPTVGGIGGDAGIGGGGAVVAGAGAEDAASEMSGTLEGRRGRRRKAVCAGRRAA